MSAILPGSFVMVLCVGVVMAAEPANESEKKAIQSLIEDLVFDHPRAAEAPLISPGIAGRDDPAYKREFEKCRAAFAALTKLKEKAFPFLLAHFKDERESIHFKNHSLAKSVGAACYRIVYNQLEDRPVNYSSYGLTRKGRDGESHTKPYWDGTPFADDGGLAKWLKKNEKLSYQEMQIQCLTWLLDGEKAIGAPDAESYFENILPLEIQILKRKLESGADVQSELTRLQTALAKKDVSVVPPDLLQPLRATPIQKEKKRLFKR